MDTAILKKIKNVHINDSILYLQVKESRDAYFSLANLIYFLFPLSKSCRRPRL